MTFRSLVTCLLSSLLLLACDSSPKEDDFGLRKFSLTMDSESLGELNNSSQAKRPFSARLSLDGRNYQVRINYAGKSTLNAPKKSLDLEVVGAAIDGREKIRLSAQYVDDSLLRSLIGFHTFAKAGVYAPRTEPVVVYLNSEYLGLYHMIEPVDEQFFAVRGLRLEELIKTKFANSFYNEEFIGRMGEVYSIKYGPKDFYAIRTLGEQVISDDAQSYENISKLLDIEQYMRYVAAAVSLNHWDGFKNNHYLARFGDGRYRIIPWDLDRIYEQGEEGVVGLYGRFGLSDKVFSHEPYRLRYLEILSEVLTENPVEARLAFIDEYADKIRAAYQQDRFLMARGDFDENINQVRKNIEEYSFDLQAEFQLNWTQYTGQ